MLQTVYFISENVPDYYPSIDKHYTWYPIHMPLTYEQFSERWQQNEPYAIYTHGENNRFFHYLSKIFNVRKRWVHLSGEVPKELDISKAVFSASLVHPYEHDHPMISVITSTFHSGKKILRPFQSLQNQTYTNWEWIVWDDSTSNSAETYEHMLELQKKDLRIRVYRAPKHSGSIGEMKRLACGVSYGSFVLELDHDDDMHPELFQWIINAAKTHQDADFFYCDTSHVYETTKNTHCYNEYFGYGYGSQINVWSEFFNKWICQIITPVPNPVTIQHLVGLPNHVRVWRTEFYDKIGKHNPRLTVSDDYELLVKSFIHGKWCYIQKCGYYQYLNEDGNFTYIRNSLIQHNVRGIYHHYKDHLHLLPKLPDTYKYQPYWKMDNESSSLFPVVHSTYDPFPHDYSIIMIDPCIEKIEYFMKLQDISLHVYLMGYLSEMDGFSIEWKHKISWWEIKNKDYFTTDVEKYRYLSKIARGKYIVASDDFYLSHEK